MSSFNASQPKRAGSLLGELKFIGDEGLGLKSRRYLQTRLWQLALPKRHHVEVAIVALADG